MVRSRGTVCSLVKRSIVRGDDTTHIYLHEFASARLAYSRTLPLPNTDPAIPEHQLSIIALMVACFRVLHSFVHNEMTSGGTRLLPTRVQTNHAANDAPFRKRTVSITRLRCVPTCILQMSTTPYRRFSIIPTATQRTTSPQCIPNRGSLAILLMLLIRCQTTLTSNVQNHYRCCISLIGCIAAAL